jgi:hypothetical protein
MTDLDKKNRAATVAALFFCTEPKTARTVGKRQY